MKAAAVRSSLIGSEHLDRINLLQRSPIQSGSRAVPSLASEPPGA
jgi:hypothetical protein